MIKKTVALVKGKKRELTPEQKLEQGRSKVGELFNGFIKLDKELEQVDSDMEIAQAEALKEAESLLAKAERKNKLAVSIMDERKSNSGLRQKIREFIPQGGNE